MVKEPHCCLNNQSFFPSPLSTNMRIPSAAELLAFFATTGQFSGLSNQRKIDIILFLISTRLTLVGFHFI